MRLPFKEQFLQFVWQYQYFSHNALHLTTGEAIEIIHPGFRNSDAGPDFIQAKIKIGDILWVGSVEIHLNSADWNVHNHQLNAAYDNVVLHVVYEDDAAFLTRRSNGSVIPVFVIGDLIPKGLIEKGNSLFENIAPILCSSNFSQIDNLTLQSTMDRAVISRLERKAISVLEILKSNSNDWEETTFQLLAQHFGMKVNNDPFVRLAQLTPLKLLSKHNGSLMSVEALLYGQAGFLHAKPREEDDYFEKLAKEYSFLKHKYNLVNRLSISDWKHLRLRPFNFPEKRIAELAALYSKTPMLHASLIEISDSKELLSLLKTEISPYWQNHFRFGEPSAKYSNSIGNEAVESLIINVVCVLLVSYGVYRNDTTYFDKALKILESIKPENNKIIREWMKLKVQPNSAFESQALIELFNNYCSTKKCLSCSIGVHILRR